MILEDMYQEMEELQARSVVLSDLAKSHMVYDFRNDKPFSSSGSEYSLIPRQKSEVVPTAHNYVLGGSRSGSPHNNGDHILTAREAGRWDEVSPVSNNKVPRKVSSASVNLSRGKQNRRRPRSIHSISSTSVDEDTDRYRFDAKLTEASPWMETKIS